MNECIDLIIVGAGPAGMSAAIMARRYGMKVMIVDEQASPGGQIWRSVEAQTDSQQDAILGKAYTDGRDVVRQFRECGADYRPRTRVWQVEAGPRVYMTCDGVTECVDAKCLLLSTGAQERPVPFPGWTLPGVMTVGAGQILLKSSRQIPSQPVWIAGSGPLALLYAVQLLKAGGDIAGFLDTTPPGRLFSVIPQLITAIVNMPLDVLKGTFWLATLLRKVNYIRGVVALEALGDNKLERLSYTTKNGKKEIVDASLVLVHEGIIPTIHPTLALDCEHTWNVDQDSFAPTLDLWGESSTDNIFVAGDGAGIGGVLAACLRGKISALQMAVKAGFLSQSDAIAAARPLRTELKRALAVRPFLDTLYRPRASMLTLADDTIVCRCEEVCAADVRRQATSGSLEPNKIKAFTRAGMGPCQGRQCNYTVANMLANAAGKTVPDIGLYRVRPPFKPLTLNELSTLETADSSATDLSATNLETTNKDSKS